MRSIRARFDSRTLSQLRLDSIMGNSRMLESSSNRARIESIRNCDRVLESNRARIERISNRIAIVTGFSNRIELESSSNRNCDRRFDSIRARFELDLIREWKKLNMFILFSNARIEIE